MAGKTILILGGGWGGLTAAHHLRGLLSSEHRILVIERSATFSLGVSNLGLMTGERESVRQIRRDMAKLKRPGIEWIHAEVRGVDPESRSVETDAGTFSGDYLVLALGAELAPEQIAGFADSAFNLYDADSKVAASSSSWRARHFAARPLPTRQRCWSRPGPEKTGSGTRPRSISTPLSRFPWRWPARRLARRYVL
jgi:NADPH-dependent 2,4-dienoyl-CoA reductase/sulfur reductase-like enzyme